MTLTSRIVARVRDSRRPSHSRFRNWALSIKSVRNQNTKHRRSRNVALGTRVLYRRVDRSFAWIHRHIGGGGRNRQDFVLSISDSLPGYIDGPPAAQIVSKANL